MAAPSRAGRPSETGVECALLFEALPDAVLVISDAGVITQVNAAAERLFGYERNQLVGHDHRMVLTEGYRNGFERLLARLRRDQDTGNDAPFTFESYGLSSD